MKRTRTIALLAVLTVATLPGLTAAVQTDVAVTDVEVSPDQPVPGDEITIESTIENADSVGFFVDKVSIEEDVEEQKDEEPEDAEEYDKVLDIGTLEANDSRTVPLTVSFEDEGSYDLRVKVWGRPNDGGKRTKLQFPVTVEVRERSPLVDIDTNESIVGVRTDATVTLANRFSSDIEDVELTVDGESVTVTNERDVLGAVESDETRTVEFEYRPDSPGSHSLNTTVTYRRPSGAVDTVSATTTIRARSAEPQVDIGVNDSMAGFEANGTVEVANGVGADIQNVEVTVDSEDVTVRNDRTVYTRVTDGDAVTSGFDIEADEPGTHELTASVRYTTGDGTVRTVTETFDVETDAVTDRVSLDVSSDQAADSQALVVDVLNQGNAPVTNVTVRTASPNATGRQALVGRVPDGESRTVRLNTTLSADRATVDVSATYDLGNRQGQAAATTTLSQTPGTISLTGIEVVPENDRLRVSGSASNLGTTDAESVLVSVVDTGRVTPSEPAREFFVGTVPASDFVSFDVYATADRNVSTIPLEVSYLVDDDRRTRTVDVDATAAMAELAARERASRDQSGGPPLVPVAVGAVVVVVVVALAVRAWRGRRGGD
jgi:hypothetical protein